MRPTLTRPNAHRGQDGVSLVEMVVAVLILSIAVVGLFRVFDQASLSIGANRERLVAGMITRNIAEDISLGTETLPQSVRMAGADWQVVTETRVTTAGFEEITIRVRPASGGAGAVLLTYGEVGSRQ